MRNKLNEVGVDINPILDQITVMETDENIDLPVVIPAVEVGSVVSLDDVTIIDNTSVIVGDYNNLTNLIINETPHNQGETSEFEGPVLMEEEGENLLSEKHNFSLLDTVQFQNQVMDTEATTPMQDQGASSDPEVVQNASETNTTEANVVNLNMAELSTAACSSRSVLQPAVKDNLLVDILKIPSPIPKGRRVFTDTEKPPSAISSEAYRAYLNSKLLKKQEKEKLLKSEKRQH